MDTDEDLLVEVTDEEMIVLDEDQIDLNNEQAQGIEEEDDSDGDDRVE